MEFFRDMMKGFKAMGMNVEVTEGEDLLPTARIKNDPVKVQVEEFDLSHLVSPEAAEIIAKDERDNIVRTLNNFSNGVDIHKDFRKIDIDKLVSCAGNWNYFSKPSVSQFASLIASIEQIGIINPLILLCDGDDHDEYTILSGHSRYFALKTLYANTKDEKYKLAPAFVLSRKEVSEYFARALVLDSNFSYRDIDQSVLIKAFIERYEILKRTKMYRSERNIAEALADEFLMSRSTVFNFLCLRKLCDEVMVLLLEKRIKLQSARYLARVDHESQRMILKKYGIENINIIHRVKLLTESDVKSEEQLERRIETANKIVPFTTNVSVHLNKDLVGKYVEVMAEFNEFAMMNYEGKFQRGNSDYYFGVRFNDLNMGCYLEKGIVDEGSLARAKARTFGELKIAKGV